MEWRQQRPQATTSSRQRVIILAGLPGSGKTTVAGQLQSLGWVWVNQDTLGSRRACEETVVNALAAGREVVVDRCNFDISQRSTFLQLARRFGAVVIALQLTTPVHECIRRAQARPDHPTLTEENTAAVVQRFAQEFVGVHPSEGFEEVYTAGTQEEVGRFVSYLGPAQQNPPGYPAPLHHHPVSQPFPAQQPIRHAPYSTLPDMWRESSGHAPHSQRAYAQPSVHQGRPPYRDPRSTQAPAQQWHSQPSQFVPRDQLHAQQHGQQPPFLGNPQLQQQRQQQQPRPQQQYQQRQQPQLPLPPHPGHHDRSGTARPSQNGDAKSSIVPFPGNSGKWRSASVSAKAVAPQRFLDLEAPKLPNDTRPIALFDLNGTLTSHTAKRRSAGVNKMRPGIHHLRRLHETFRIGIFTSASSRTVATVVPMLEHAAGSNGRPLLAEKGFILTRNHTVAAPASHVKSGGNTWDTVKPLNQWFKDLSRVILVDDDAYKAVPGEENNMIVVPCWDSNDDDTVLAALTDALLDIMGTLSADADVRHYTKAVQEAVASRVGRPVGGGSGTNPEEMDLDDADDSLEEERQEHSALAATPIAEQSHQVLYS